MDKKTSYKIIIYTLCIMIIIIVASAYGYNKEINDTLSNSIQETLGELLLQQRFNITSQLEANLDSMTNIAATIAKKTINYDTDFAILDDLIENTSFDTLSLADLNGIMVIRTGIILDVSEREYYKRALNGENYIGTPIQSKGRDIVIVPIAVPIYYMGEIIGVLVGSYTIDDLSSLMLPVFNGNGNTYIFDNKGNIIATTNERIDKHSLDLPSMLDGLDSVEYFISGSKEQMQYDMENGLSNNIIFEAGDVVRYNFYMPLEVNDWYVMISVDDDMAFHYMIEIQKHTFTFVVIISLCIITNILVLFILLFKDKKQLEASKEELHASVDELKVLSTTDPLTGILSRRGLEEKVKAFLENAPKEQEMAMLMIDLDGLKAINDTIGHQAGDEAIKKVADALVKTFRFYDIIGKLGGDEFMAFLPKMGTYEGAISCAIRLIELLHDSQDGIKVSVSIGIAIKKNEIITYDEFYRRADVALYEAKNNGKDRFAIYQD